MKVLYSPQVNENAKFIYSFGNNKVDIIYQKYEYAVTQAKYDEDGRIIRGLEKVKNILVQERDILDLSELDNSYDQVLTSVDTDLPVNPVIDIMVKDGEIKVKLLNFITSNATDEEKFPQVMEV